MQFSDILVKNALFCDETEDYRTPAEPEAGDSVHKAVDRAARYAQIRAVERGKAVKGLFKTAYFDHFASPSLHNA